MQKMAQKKVQIESQTITHSDLVSNERERGRRGGRGEENLREHHQRGKTAEAEAEMKEYRKKPVLFRT